MFHPETLHITLKIHSKNIDYIALTGQSGHDILAFGAV